MIKSLSIIFPFYNEEPRLKASFNHILNFIRKKPAFKIEIILCHRDAHDFLRTVIIWKYQNEDGRYKESGLIMK